MDEGMNKIDYNLGLLKRLAAGTVNGKPYVMLEDVEYIIKNSGLFDEIECSRHDDVTTEDILRSICSLERELQEDKK